MDFEILARWSEIIGGFAFVAVAYWLFRKYLLPAVTANQIAHNAELNEAEKQRTELRERIERAQAENAAAARQAAAIAAQAQIDAQKEFDRVLTEGRRDASRLLTNAQGELERSRAVARDHLRLEFVEKALARARALATERVTDAVNARLVNRVVDDLSAGKAN